MTPEQEARAKIDRLLEQAGWQFTTEVHARGSQRDGFADYILSDSEGVIRALLEAKAAGKHPLAGKEQARDYAHSRLNLQYVLLSNGDTHYFWDTRAGNPNRVLTIPSPEGVARPWGRGPVDRSRLATTAVAADYLPAAGIQMRPYQLAAIAAVQQAAVQGETAFLLEMATGVGKTTVAAALCYLYIATGNAEHILFLVDRIELKDQTGPALREALAEQYTVGVYSGQEDYNWGRTHITVMSIQTLEGLDLPPEHFDLIIADEAHRCISGPSRRRLFERLQGEKIGLTATPRALLRETEDAAAEESPLRREQQALRDTYFAFGRPPGEPTYAYTMEEARRDGYLVGPTAVDVRTELTRELLSEQGLELDVVSLDDEVAATQTFYPGNLGRNLFIPATRREFAETILDEALREPGSNLIGKTIVYTPTQIEALELTNALNLAAMARWPGLYQSDFAVAVTSDVDRAADYGRQFKNNTLHGSAHPEAPGRLTSKTRVCVTVRMMTTGYDCPDLLNIALCCKMDSPTEFIQVKGRGTRRYDFRDSVTDPRVRETLPSYPKESFKIIDFFGVCERHHEGHIYEPRLGPPAAPAPGPPVPNGNNGGSEPSVPSGEQRYIHYGPDHLESATQLELGPDGQTIDARIVLERGFTRRNYELRQAFNRYLESHPLANPEQAEQAQQLFEAYATTPEVRAAVDAGRPGQLIGTGLEPQVLRALPRERVQAIIQYVREHGLTPE